MILEMFYEWTLAQMSDIGDVGKGSIPESMPEGSTKQTGTKASVTGCVLHDLRRSCITNWAHILPIHVVQKLAGHSDIKTTQKYYLAVRQEDMERARILQSKILANDLTDPLLTHFSQKQPKNGFF
jgi:hypothetical protein